MLRKIYLYFIERPFLVILIIMLFVATMVNIKPNYFLIGWDNYSSYFKLDLNIFRTLFSTWREYRGLGVPSDSEVTDIWRLLLLMVLKIFLPVKLLDQLYYLLALWGGVLGMYFLGDFLLRKGDKREEEKDENHSDLFGFLAAFFYLFNLNTLAVFYFPMPMFATRFFSLPILFYGLLNIAHNQKSSLPQYIFFCLLLFLTSGSYLVPTVFITTCFIVAILLLTQGRFKRAIMVLIFFLAFNSFWILPFINYVIQKSPAVRLAPAFVDGNEDFLNKGKVYYSLARQSIFYPQFFNITYSKSKNNLVEYYHYLAAIINKYPKSLLILYIFPLLYFIGSGLIFLNFKKHRRLLWVPLITIGFLILSMKEYSPLGFLYTFLSNLVPYFKIIFRFTDTKFHANTAFAGSLAAAFACLYIYTRVKNHKLLNCLKTFFILFFLLTLFIYRGYFSGQLIGFFMYNNIPQAYFDLVNVINQDSKRGRVIHLPVENRSSLYWKSYNWGYFGSTFLHYLIDAPLIDKTFEPGSEENAVFDALVDEAGKEAQELSQTSSFQNKIAEFYTALKKGGVTYLILDETVSARQVGRGIDTAGSFNLIDSQVLVRSLENTGALQLVGVFPVREAEGNLSLYKVIDSQAKIRFLKTGHSLEQSNRFLIAKALKEPADVIYKKGERSFDIYPFLHRDAKIIFENQIVNYQLDFSKNISGHFNYELGRDLTKASRLIQIQTRNDGRQLIFSLFEQYLPSIENQSFLKPIVEIDVPLEKIPANTTVKISIAGKVVSDNEALIVDLDSFDFQVLALNSVKPINNQSFVLSPNEGCFADKLTDYQAQLKTAVRNDLILNSQNGSTCLLADLKPYLDKKTSYFEVQFDASAISRDWDKKYSYGVSKKVKDNTNQPDLKEFIESLPKVQHLKGCLKEMDFNECYSEVDINLSPEEKSFVIPLSKTLDFIVQPQLLLILRNLGYQKQEMRVSNLRLFEYQKIFSQTVNLAPLVFASSTPVEIAASRRLNFSFVKPTPLAQDSLHFVNTPCPYYRTWRRWGNDVISYVNSCDNVVLKEVPFSSNKMYLWQISYDLIAGQYPSLVIADKFYQYLNERISLDDGYPDVRAKDTYIILHPSPGLDDMKKKAFSIKQYSENEGVFRIKKFNLIELPSAWANLGLKSIEEKTYSLPATFQLAKILPSLWQLKFVSEKNGFYLIDFNEGYDKQWLLIPADAKSLVFGNSLAQSLRCNGYANCFEIRTTSQGEQSYYLFYWPERLSLMGWGLTALVIFFFAVLMVRREKIPS